MRNKASGARRSRLVGEDAVHLPRLFLAGVLVDGNNLRLDVARTELQLQYVPLLYVVGGACHLTVHQHAPSIASFVRYGAGA